MFKALGNLIHRTPWWAVVSGGLVILIGLVLFAVPIQVIRLHESGSTPQQKRAIEREINLAFGDTALNFAEEVVRAMRAGASDPDRQRELDRALSEIERAKKELSAAQSNASHVTRQAAKETADAALESATEAAEAALESAVEARRAVEEARDDAIELLRDRGLDFTATARSFDGMLKTAADNEKAAQDALDSIKSLRVAPPANTAPAGREKLVELEFSRPSDVPLLPDALRGEIRDKVDNDVWRVGVGSALILAFLPLFIVLLISKYFIGRSRRALAVAEEKTQEAQLSHMSRQITEARLQALQAQVEPHFLYNTLANVQALTEVDALAANKMVGHLIAYLRASLPKMRETTSTVGQELELVRAYLNILQMRMGERLQFVISAPTDVLAKSFPPMMLPSLVENAIKHGLEPLREGGRIDVLVEQTNQPSGGRILVQVKDTGKGLSGAPIQAGGGIGLANIRERLAAIYAGQARFGIESNTPRGVVASIDLPNEAPQFHTSTPVLGAGVSSTNQGPLQSGWRRAQNLTSRSHSLWARVVARTFIVLMVSLCIAFLAALAGLYSGWMPVQVGDLRLNGMEGMAVGSVGLLAAFSAVALAILIVVAVLYGLGFFFAALLVLIPLVIVLSLFPVLVPGIVVALGIYWWVRRRNKTQA
jgi:hypothetical protein